LDLMICDLEFAWDLVLGIWNFNVGWAAELFD
jgi:hypothetical protein